MKQRRGKFVVRRTGVGQWVWGLFASNGQLLISAPKVYTSKRNAVKAMQVLYDLLQAKFFTVEVRE